MDRRIFLNKLPYFFVKHFSTTSKLNGKRNFKKFLMYNKGASRFQKQAAYQNLEKYAESLKIRGVKPTGYYIDQKYVEIKEKIPEIIVPDLRECKLKPYVSYKTSEVIQSEFTSLDLFKSVYSEKIINDFKTGQLSDDGSPQNSSEEEKLTPEKAHINARKTGSDIF